MIAAGLTAWENNLEPSNTGKAYRYPEKKLADAFFKCKTFENKVFYFYFFFFVYSKMISFEGNIWHLYYNVIYTYPLNIRMAIHLFCAEQVCYFPLFTELSEKADVPSFSAMLLFFYFTIFYTQYSEVFFLTCRKQVMQVAQCTILFFSNKKNVTTWATTILRFFFKTYAKHSNDYTAYLKIFSIRFTRLKFVPISQIPIIQFCSV